MGRRPPPPSELVEQQILRWQAAQRARRAAAQASGTPSERASPPPAVTVSREAWSQGTELAKRVAERLGFDLWDQELVHRVAEQAGVSRAMLEAIDEHRRGVIENLIGAVLHGEMLSEREYVAQLLAVIHAVAEHGRAVIVGRGAQFVLAPASVLRVRVVCPVEVRTENLARASGRGAAAAREEIARIDRERATFVRSAFDRDVADTAAYDLVVNTGWVSLDRGVDLVAAAYRAKFE